MYLRLGRRAYSIGPYPVEQLWNDGWTVRLLFEYRRVRILQYDTPPRAAASQESMRPNYTEITLAAAIVIILLACGVKAYRDGQPRSHYHTGYERGYRGATQNRPDGP